MNIEYLEILFNQGQLLAVLENLRPNNYISISQSSKLLHDYLQQIKYILLKRWTNVPYSVSSLVDKVPGITFEQMNWCANYYYPIYKEYDPDYDNNELFYNACRANYSAEDCMEFVGNQVQHTHIASAIASGRNDVLELLNGRDDEHLLDEYTDSWLELFIHRDITIPMFVDLIYNYWVETNNKDAYNALIGMIGSSNGSTQDVIRAINMSEDPSLITLASKLGIQYKALPISADFDEYLLDKCGIFDMLEYNLHTYTSTGGYIDICTKLSRYNSYKYPSYDILDDYLCGNILELINKLNTYNNDIQVKKPYTTVNSHNNNWVNSSYGTKYNSALLKRREEIAGQAAYYIHPVYIDAYLYFRGLEIVYGSRYMILRHWCFPEYPLSSLVGQSVTNIITVTKNLSSYYWPVPSVDQGGKLPWDTSLLWDRALEAGYSDEHIMNLLGILTPEISMNCAILCFVYDRLNLLDNEKPEHRLFTKSEIYNPKGQIVHMVLNHMYLYPEEKLNILSRFTVLPEDLLAGISGNVDINSNYNIAGLVLNATSSVDDINKMLKVFDRTLEVKLDIEEVKQLLKQLQYRSALGDNFPTGLLYTTTNVLQKMSKLFSIYESARYQLGGLPGSGLPISSYEQAIAVGDYYLVAIKHIDRSYIPVISKYGYEITHTPY